MTLLLSIKGEVPNINPDLSRFLCFTQSFFPSMRRMFKPLIHQEDGSQEQTAPGLLLKILLFHMKKKNSKSLVGTLKQAEFSEQQSFSCDYKLWNQHSLPTLTSSIADSSISLGASEESRPWVAITKILYAPLSLSVSAAARKLSTSSMISSCQNKIRSMKDPALPQIGAKTRQDPVLCF